ncbi:hypothetical protein GJV85_06880 [Sulfurimonas aquatica]|uniref:WD40 repeat domain-containing protein n=1 Tax=Sulfurimonas aquatica TaxID=2672570 RepID=A0A975GCL6_9BACT|nr:hypothetical protein [Sulfurimonas aquatica]QSZ41841.1 hypothetical protein GJV85_06880 [Sulfurimonas aquatica]
MEVLKNKGIGKPIVLLKILEDKRLLVVDSDTTIRFLNKDNFKVLDGFKVNIKHERYKNSVVEFSNDGVYFSTLTSDCKESRLYNTQTKKIITRVDRHHGEASCVGIDPLNRYMFSCGDDGKTFALDMKSGKLVFTLPVHVDTVNDIAFSANANWVATASYDKKISLFNLVTMAPKEKLKAHAAAVMKLKFLTKNRLLSVDKNSSVIIWNIYSGKIIERLQGIHDEVLQVTVSADGKFLFLGTTLGYVLLYDLDTYEQLSERYIKISSPITALEFDSELNHLLIGTGDGVIMTYDIYEGEKNLKELLATKDFDSIQKAAEVNPILAYTKVYNLVNDLWGKTLEKAKISLQKGDKKTALLLFDHFKNIPSKNSIIQKTIKEYAEFEKFSNFAKQGKLALAYSLANSFPDYKESSIYKALEKRWQKALIEAQKLSLQPRGGMDMAREKLAPYRGLSSKTKIIQELLSQADVYNRFRTAIGQKDFKLCFELLKQHSFLKEFPEYDILNQYGDSLYIKSEQYISAGEINRALKTLRILSDFNDFKDDVKELMLIIESKNKFIKAIEAEDMVTAYNMLAIAEELLDTPEGEKLQKQWNEDLQNAHFYAVQGDEKGVEESLKKYMNMTSKHMALATVFAWCYIVQLENAMESGVSRQEIENGIKNYMLNFGFQEHIEGFFDVFKEKYPESKLSIELLTQGSLSMWRPSMIAPSILD